MTSSRDQQIRAVYRAALERPPAERTSFVADLSGGDEQLRHSVERLLSQQGATDVGATDVGASGTAPGGDAAAELPPGTLLGHYRLDGVLGRGGIGTVYRATDTKLNRPVAIKFLTAAVADADARRRFKQEAETASALNHPHIVTVYDVGEHDGRQYIVSELVDGGTLDDWAAAAKHSWRQSVELLTGVADALAAAHAAGVLHRDVKPGNILIGANGYAKLADFGLAKLLDTGAGDPASGPRPDSRRTREGLVVGTVAYMSPEQAAGQPLDARSDVFSFGIVLYERLAGKRPFDAKNDLELLKAIAHAAPPPLPDSVPELLQMAVDKALEKEPADRYQTMQDFVADLRRATRKTGSQPAVAPAMLQRRTRTAWLAGAGVGIALSAVVAVTMLHFVHAPPAPAQQVRFTIAVPGYQLGGLAISPDGKRIAYASDTSGTRQTWIRPIDSLEAHPLPGADNARGLFWSPDGRYLAFDTGGKLEKIDVGGGPAQAIVDEARSDGGGSWSRGGTILYGDVDYDLALLTEGRSSAWPVPREPGEAFRTVPWILPDSDHFVYLSIAPAATEKSVRVFVGSLVRRQSSLLTILPPNSGPPPPTLVQNLAYADGYLLYLLGNGVLTALPFDPGTLAVGGQPQLIADRVAEFSVSTNGVLVYREQGSPAPGGPLPSARRLTWVDRRGEHVGQVDAPANFRRPVLSRDGRSVAVDAPAENGASDVWTLDTKRGTSTRLTFDPAVDDLAIWSPDDTQLVFSSGRNAVPAIESALYRRAANGTGSDELLFAGEGDELLRPLDWSPDGHVLVFSRSHVATWITRGDLWTLELTGEHKARSLIASPARKASARLSPDGRWIAYSTNESKDDQIVVQPFPNVGQGKWQVSTQGGGDPKWRADGRELYYMTPNGDVMAVDVDTTADVFTNGAPHRLFATGITTVPGAAPDYYYDVTPDGQKFLLNEPTPAASTQTTQNAAAAPADLPLDVIVNWSAGLRRQ